MEDAKIKWTQTKDQEGSFASYRLLINSTTSEKIQTIKSKVTSGYKRFFQFTERNNFFLSILTTTVIHAKAGIYCYGKPEDKSAKDFFWTV